MPRRDSELMARLLATFQVEADEHLVALRRHLLELSAERPEPEARELVETTFRDMHTLKGAARSVGQRDVERVCASCESLLSVLKRSERLPSAEVIVLLEEAVAAIGALVEGGAGTPTPADLLERLDRAVINPADIGPSDTLQAADAQAAAPSPPADLAAGAGAHGAAPSPRADLAAGAGSHGAAPSPRADLAADAGSHGAAPSPRADLAADAGAHGAAATPSADLSATAAASPPAAATPRAPSAFAAPPVPVGVATLEAAPHTPATSAETSASRAAATIRMATEDLDVLLQRGEELLSIKLVADEWLTGVEAFHEQLRRAQHAEDPFQAIRALEATARGMVTGVRRDRRTIAGAVDGLLEQAQRVRMMPASSVLDLLPLMVRDLANSQNKRVEFTATGGDLRVDRRVLEAIKSPLIHMVRNAVDHGLELPAEREAAGKPPVGKITATVRPLERGRVEFVLADDGRGIDPQKVQDAARRARIAAPTTDEEALALIFRSGLSTAFVITDVSGHGLGLAIVKEQIEKLGGDVGLDTKPGTGTTFRLIAPATIATFRGLLVRSGGQRFLLPIESVERAIAAEPLTQGGQLKIRYEDELLPCAPLAELLGLEAPHLPDDRIACAILTVGSQRAGVLIDEIVGDREVLVKDFEPPLVRVRNVAAAGLLGAGELVLVLRPSDLIAGASEARKASTAIDPATVESDGPPWVLVVDDAVTTRAMERGLLELAGYQVKVAVDGLDAWTTLKSERFDLVVSDVDMPRMNGFELTQRIRADETLQDLPVVLVSALEAREDKERGIEVGANAYVVKSSFEQSNLLEIIDRLGVRP